MFVWLFVCVACLFVSLIVRLVGGFLFVCLFVCLLCLCVVAWLFVCIFVCFVVCMFG